MGTIVDTSKALLVILLRIFCKIDIGVIEIIKDV